MSATTANKLTDDGTAVEVITSTTIGNKISHTSVFYDFVTIDAEIAKWQAMKALQPTN